MEERREKQVHLPHDKGYKRDLSKPKEIYSGCLRLYQLCFITVRNRGRRCEA